MCRLFERLKDELPEGATVKKQAEKFFLKGMTNAMHRFGKYGHPTFPVTIYYAFKQSESRGRPRHDEHGLGDISKCYH